MAGWKIPQSILGTLNGTAHQMKLTSMQMWGCAMTRCAGLERT